MQLGDEQVYEEVFSNDAAPLPITINEVMIRIRKRRDLKRDNLDYFIMKDLKFARSYILPQIHKRLHNFPGRPVISNSGYYTEKISSFLDHHLQPIAQVVKSYIKALTNSQQSSVLSQSSLMTLFYERCIKKTT